MKKFIVIGVGRMGSKHATNLLKNRVDGACLAAIADCSTEALRKFESAHGKVRCFTDWRRCVEEIKPDAAIIATPHYSHVPIASELIAGGIAVLSEKPEAVETCEAIRMNEIAAAHPETPFAIMYNQRTNPVYMRAKEIVDSGALGRLKRVTLTVTDWYRSQNYYDQGGWRASWSGEGGGVLINQCVHQLDVLQWLVGMPERIYAHAGTVNRNITVENEMYCYMEYPDGLKGTFTASAHELKGSNLLEIAADKGKLTIGKYSMKYYRFTPSEEVVNATAKRGYGKAKVRVKRYRYGLIKLIRDALFGQQLNVIGTFADFLNGKAAKPVAYGVEGARALEFINAAYMSAYSGKAVSLPIDPEEYSVTIAKFKEEEKNNGKVFVR